MKILIYKRTHKGDPDEKGVFGNQDCMGRIRNWDYDAVIGIGGKATWKESKNIKYKINWVGLKPKKINAPGQRGDCVVFSHFKLYEETGESIKDNYPELFKHMYDSGKRFDMSSKLPENVSSEVQKILKLVENSPQSKDYAIKIANNIFSKELHHSAKCKSSFGGKNIEESIEINEICGDEKCSPKC